MAPFAGTRVIHPAWAARHASVAADAMNATCEIATYTAADWSPDDGAVPGTKTVLYTGRCRVQAQSNQPDQGSAAGQPITGHTYLVAITRDAPVIPAGDKGAKVTILTVDPNGDAALAGRVLSVKDARYSSLAWERDLTCVDDLTNQPT